MPDEKTADDELEVTELDDVSGGVFAGGVQAVPHPELFVNEE